MLSRNNALTVKEIFYVHNNDELMSLVGTYSSHLHKMIYLGNRRYTTSALRKTKRGFPSGDVELQPPPAKKNFKELRDIHYAYDNVKTR